MKPKRIAIGGSAANPPQIGHLALLNALVNCNMFDSVIWIPSGGRTDKQFGIEPDHRVAMTELTFPDILRIRPGATLTIKYDDVYGKNTPTIERLERLQKKYPKAEIFWYTGVDSVVPRKRFDGKCEIEGKWIRGNELFKKWKFIVFPRVGYKMPTNLPSNFQIINIKLPNVASSQIRKLIANGKPFEHLVTAGVAEYIKRYKLYQGGG